MCPRRRTLLQSAGLAVASLAGCLNRQSSGRGDSGPAVTNPRLRKMVVLDFDIWGDVRVADGQFLVVDVSGFPDDTREYPLDVTLDGERVAPGEERPFRMTGVVPPGAEPVNPERVGTHAAAMDVPARRVDAAAVVEPGLLDGGRWDLPESVVEALPRVPAFELRSVEATAVDGGVDLSVEVANTGDRTGVWLGQVSARSFNDVSEVFGLRVPVGETVARTVRPGILADYDPGDVTVQLFSTTDVERTVTIPEPTATDA